MSEEREEVPTNVKIAVALAAVLTVFMATAFGYWMGANDRVTYTDYGESVHHEIWTEGCREAFFFLEGSAAEGHVTAVNDLCDNLYEGM